MDTKRITICFVVSNHIGSFPLFIYVNWFLKEQENNKELIMSNKKKFFIKNYICSKDILNNYKTNFQTQIRLVCTLF